MNMVGSKFPAVASRCFIGSLFVAIPLLYFLYLPVSYSFDGTVFSHMLRYALLKHDWLGIAQIHHLMYFPLNYWLYRALQALFRYQVLEFFHLQLFSMFFSVATLFLVERLLKKLAVDTLLRAAGVAMVAFSYAFWLFSVDAEVHIPGFFFTMAGMCILASRRMTALALAGAACCFAIAAGFHLTNMLAVIAALLFLLVQRTPWKQLAKFCAIYAAVLLVMFGAYSLLSGKSVLAIVRIGLAGNDAYSGYPIAYGRSLSWATVLSSLASLKHALAAGSGPASVLLPAGCLLLLVLGIFRPGAAAERRCKRAMMFWTLPYLLFFSVWDPGNPEFKIHVVVPLLLVAIVAMSGLKPLPAHTLAAILAIGLLGVNLSYGIKPQSETANNSDYQTAVAIRRATPDNAQVLITGRIEGYGFGKIYIPYFAGREVLVLDWLLGKGHALPEVMAELSRRAGSGRPLYTLEEIALPGKTLSALLDFHKVSGKDRALFASAIRFIPVMALPGGHRLFRLEFKPL